MSFPIWQWRIVLRRGRYEFAEVLLEGEAVLEVRPAEMPRCSSATLLSSSWHELGHYVATALHLPVLEVD